MRVHTIFLYALNVIRGAEVLRFVPPLSEKSKFKYFARDTHEAWAVL